MDLALIWLLAFRLAAVDGQARFHMEEKDSLEDERQVVRINGKTQGEKNWIPLKPFNGTSQKKCQPERRSCCWAFCFTHGNRHPMK